MKKLIATLLALTMIFCLAACGENDKDDRSDRKKNDETIIEETEEIGDATTEAAEVAETTEAPEASVELVVTVPDGWEKNEASTSLFQYQKNLATFIIIEEKSCAGMSLTEAAETYFQSLSSAFDDVTQVGETTEYDMNGIDAIRFTFTAKVGLDMKYTYFLFKAGSSFYAGTLGTTVSEYPAMEADFEQIASQAVSIA